jgi:hypothetical protein
VKLCRAVRCRWLLMPNCAAIGFRLNDKGTSAGSIEERERRAIRTQFCPAPASVCFPIHICDTFSIDREMVQLLYFNRLTNNK